VLTLSEGRVARVPDSRNEDRDSCNSSLRELQADHSSVIFCGTAPRLAELSVELSSLAGRAGSPLPAAPQTINGGAHGAARPAGTLALSLFPKFVIRPLPVSCWGSAVRTWRIRAKGSVC